MTVSMTLLQLPRASGAVAMRSRQVHHGGSKDPIIDDSRRSHIDDVLKINIHSSNNNVRQYAGGSSITPKRSRLRKRHSEYLYLQQHLEESSTDLEWLNPCNGFFEPSSEESSSFVPPPSYFLGRLRMVLSREFHNINGTTTAINIDDMRQWSSYKEFYSFLPKIALNSSIALKRWYRQMQTFVATFAHLGRMQYKFDRLKRMSTSELTHELNSLLLSARSILCEIETAINGSYPFPNNQKKLYSFTREEMNKRLQFLTTQRFNRHNQKDMAIEPEMLDLRFAKFKYINYLRRMWRVIRMRTKRRGQQNLRASKESTNLSASAIEESISASLNSKVAHSSVSSSSIDTFGVSSESGSYAGRKIRRNRQHKRQRKSGRETSAKIAN